MFEFFFITIFFNIKLIEIFKFFSFSFFLLHLNIISLLFFTTQEITKMNRLTINRLNMINDFLVEIENYDIITLSKPDLDEEFTEINTL